ncbi:MAG: divalent-cation tolerance protein CutA [Verrucomicrobia bacterium]|nr:divalent-cation tolerance protein CutA [Verrucomicrobiota bacterium]
MKASRSFVVALVTAPDLRTARRLAQSALRNRLTACVNLIPKIESHYWWQGRLEKGSEILMVLKTTRAKLARLEKHILAAHPYDTPEFVVLPLAGGAKRYLAWLSESVAGQELKSEIRVLEIRKKTERRSPKPICG